MGVKDKIEPLLKQLNEGIYEKEEVMALALLSSIAGESIFFLGPPGVAKSLIARRLKYAYKNAKVFEYLMSRFSTPDEIFGPVAISELKKDKYVRKTDGYLPKAEVVFLDEIWKAGPSIQNALLTILNEKIFRNGEDEVSVPMKALISASNELPTKEQGLEALWDRFLVRLVVGGIEDREKFNGMVTMDSALFDEKSDEFKKWKAEIDGFAIPDDDYKDWSKKIGQKDIPENVFNVIDVIRKKIELHNHDIELYHQNERKEKEPVKELLYISDRRWRKIVRLMRTSAFLNDRKEVDLMDCFLIKHCIWNEEDQIQTVSGFVNDAIREYGPSVDLELRTEESRFEYLQDQVIKKTRKPVGNKPKLYPRSNTNYCKLTENFLNKYCLIESDVVNKAGENSKDIKIFSEKDLNDNTECCMSKASEKNSIALKEKDGYYGTSWQTYQLQTEPVYMPYKKSPGRVDYENWNKDFDDLLSVLKEKKEKAGDYWSAFSEGFYHNLFVGKKNADDFIKSKIDAVIIGIDQIIKNIGDIRENYQRKYKSNDQ
jgi:MoxR-like ATPase